MEGDYVDYAMEGKEFGVVTGREREREGEKQKTRREGKKGGRKKLAEITRKKIRGRRDRNNKRGVKIYWVEKKI